MQHSAKSEEMGLKLWSGSLIVNPLRGVPRSSAAQNRPMKNKKRFFARPHAPALAIAVVLSVGLLLAACDDGEPGDPVTKRIEELTESPDLGQAASANGQIDGADLQQANYLTESSESGQATLENGQFRAPVAPGSASELVIRLDKWVLGDLDGQAGGDAAAITIESPGGSGAFFYLHGLVNEGGALRDADFVILGDRIRVEGLSIHDGIITVAMLDRAPGEPFAAPPSVPAIRQFRLQNGKLTEVDEFVGNIAQGCELTPPDTALVIVLEPGSGEAVGSGFAVNGCSRTFESNINWRLLARSGEVLAEGFAMGGGVYGPGPFSFTVEYTSPESQLGHLEVFEIDVSDGAGFPPPRDVVPVVLQRTS